LHDHVYVEYVVRCTRIIETGKRRRSPGLEFPLTAPDDRTKLLPSAVERSSFIRIAENAVGFPKFRLGGVRAGRGEPPNCALAEMRGPARAGHVDQSDVVRFP